MPAIKVSSKVEVKVWRELQALAAESHQSIAGLLTEALREYLARKRIRPEVATAIERSIADNAELGRLLAR